MTDSIQKNFDDSNELLLNLCINNQYITVKKIGVGGFGTVWQAYDFSLRNFIAIKEMLPEYSQPKFVEMFYKEALIAKNIIHDNIVRVQHFWQGSNGSYYVVLDYVKGIDLEKLIRKCNDISIKIPWQLSTLICMGVLKAIDYANRVARDSITGNPYGIVYRDISPSNILLSFDGNIKLSDFGIAKTSDEIKDSVPEKVITGKYPYMSPEQIQGLPNIDHRTDVFSVAVLYYETLTGKQLYSGTNEEIKKQVLSKKFDGKELELDVDVDADITTKIGDVISKALEKNREDRYERAVEMYRDVRRILKGIDTEELLFELANFINRVMREDVVKSERFVEKVRTLNIQDIQQNTSIQKIACQDFIVGQTTNFVSQQIEHVVEQKDATISMQEGLKKSSVNNQVQQVQQKVSKEKTVFEEVGDWLFIKLNSIKKSIIRLLVAVILAVFIFGTLDVFVLQLTPFGKNIYSRLYPPDVVITTIPSGAVVNMTTKDGVDYVLKNVSSSSPISVKKVLPKTYKVTAVKEGFKPVTRVVQIEKSNNTNKVRKEKIELLFDFVLNVDSYPRGADVFIDGNKFGNTPCKVQLFAGAHTIKLSLENFEDLGSNSAETAKQGKCNIDFSKATVEEMFSGVDRRYWNCELKNIDEENIFSIKGSLFKKIKIDSEPREMLVHIQGEGQQRGKTPLETSFKSGTYKIRLLDPGAMYGETLKEIEVTKDSASDVLVKMDKLVSFRIIPKDNSGDTVVTSVSISNKNFNIKRNISTSKSIKIPLPVATYNVTFAGNDKYQSCVIPNVNIKNTDFVVGKLEYSKVLLNLNVISKIDDTYIERAFVWLNNKNIGKTDSAGSFKYKLKPGKYELKIIAKNYEEQTVSVNVLAGKNKNVDVFMVPEVIEEEQNYVEDYISDTTLDNSFQENDNYIQDKNKNNNMSGEKEDTTTEGQVVVCLNCGYVNTAPAGKKLRFCVNCAKNLK